MTAGRTTATSRRSTGGVHNPPVNERPPTRPELLLGHDRASLVVLLIVSPMMTTSHTVGAGLLIVAGVYQLTPLKLACLQKCQSPLNVRMHRWRSGVAGAFRMGIDHGSMTALDN